MVVHYHDYCTYKPWKIGKYLTSLITQQTRQGTNLHEQQENPCATGQLRKLCTYVCWSSNECALWKWWSKIGLISNILHKRNNIMMIRNLTCKRVDSLSIKPALISHLLIFVQNLLINCVEVFCSTLSWLQDHAVQAVHVPLYPHVSGHSALCLDFGLKYLDSHVPFFVLSTHNKHMSNC